MVRSPALALLLAALAACGKNADAPAPAPAPEPVEVAALDQFGPFAAPVTGIAFWAHPSVSFNGLVIVATEEGIAAHNIEDGAAVAAIEGFTAKGAAIVYEGEGATAQGYALTYDADARALRLFQIDNVTRALTPTGELYAADGVEAFCSGRMAGGAAVIYAVSGRTVTPLALEGGAIVPGEERPFDLPKRAAACAVYDAGGVMFALEDGGAGAIYAKGARKGRFETFATTPVAIAATSLDAGEGEGADCCGVLAVLDSEDARLVLLDADDAALIGVVKLGASFDVAGVAQASSLGLGAGNFGGAYRDGVIALATAGAAPVLRLAPFSAALDALKRPASETQGPRGVQAAETAPEEEGLSFDVAPPPQP